VADDTDSLIYESTELNEFDVVEMESEEKHIFVYYNGQ
jgi:hypothetical protein